MTPLSAMCGISAAIQGANPRHMAWPIPKRGLHVNSRVRGVTRFWYVLLKAVFMQVQTCKASERIPRALGVKPCKLHAGIALRFGLLVKVERPSAGRCTCSWPTAA